jgi:hypothetical protein
MTYINPNLAFIILNANVLNTLIKRHRWGKLLPINTYILFKYKNRQKVKGQKETFNAKSNQNGAGVVILKS